MNASAVVDLLPSATASAVHLELRDVYEPDDERFLAWRRGEAPDPADHATWWNSWHQLVAEASSRGVAVRRVRVVSEPVTAYVRYEHEITYRNIAAGEAVRWLPRRQTVDLALPPNDCWLVDGATLVVHHFSGDGDLLENEIVSSPQVVALYRNAFGIAWDRAVPHGEYVPLW